MNFIFLAIKEHPWGREMLSQLLAAGFKPSLIIEEFSEGGEIEREKFEFRIGTHPHEANLNVTILSIGADRTETNAMLRGHATENNYTWRHAIDTDTAQVEERYGVYPVPLVVVVDAEGIVTFISRGYMDYETLYSAVAVASGEEPADD